jgi:hypothetical protein
MNLASPYYEAGNNPLNHGIHDVFHAVLKNTVISPKWMVLVVINTYMLLLICPGADRPCTT